MQNYIKFLSRLPKSLQLRLISVIGKIVENKLEGLDIKPMVGFEDIYRCRVGKVRILFEKGVDENIIHDVGFRGSIY